MVQMDDRLNRALTLTLGGAIILSVIGVVCISVAPPPPSAGNEFTEFYIIGSNGTASDYPNQLEPREQDELIVGIVNHEARAVTYQLSARWNDTVTQEQQVKLANEELSERPLLIQAPTEPGVYWLHIELNIAGQETNGSYRSLQLRVRVGQ